MSDDYWDGTASRIHMGYYYTPEEWDRKRKQVNKPKKKWWQFWKKE